MNEERVGPPSISPRLTAGNGSASVTRLVPKLERDTKDRGLQMLKDMVAEAERGELVLDGCIVSYRTPAHDDPGMESYNFRVAYLSTLETVGLLHIVADDISAAP